MTPWIARALAHCRCMLDSRSRIRATPPSPKPKRAPLFLLRPPAPNQASEQHWLQVDLEEADERSRRARNALIGSSAGFVVGAIIAGIGVSQCQEVPKEQANTYDSLLCNNAGKVMLPLGPHRRLELRRHAHLLQHHAHRQQAKAGTPTRHSSQPVRPSPSVGYPLWRPGLLSASAFCVCMLKKRIQPPVEPKFEIQPVGLGDR